MLMVEVSLAGWDGDEARRFVAQLEERLPEKNSLAKDTLESYMGTGDMSELKLALTHMLDVTRYNGVVMWNPSARDMQVIAGARDICDGMAKVAGMTLTWSDDAKRSGAGRSLFTPRRHLPGSYAAVVSYSRSGGTVANARVIQSELSARLEKPVYTGDKGEALAALEASPECFVVLLLTRGVLADQEAMAEVYQGITLGRHVVPIYVHGGGYDYAAAHDAIVKFQPSWATSDATQVDAQLEDVITNMIAIDWRPDGGYNQTAAAIQELVARNNAFQEASHKAQRAQTLPNLIVGAVGQRGSDLIVGVFGRRGSASAQAPATEGASAPEPASEAPIEVERV